MLCGVFVGCVLIVWGGCFFEMDSLDSLDNLDRGCFLFPLRGVGYR